MQIFTAPIEGPKLPETLLDALESEACRAEDAEALLTRMAVLLRPHVEFDYLIASDPRYYYTNMRRYHVVSREKETQTWEFKQDDFVKLYYMNRYDDTIVRIDNCEENTSFTNMVIRNNLKNYRNHSAIVSSRRVHSVRMNNVLIMFGMISRIKDFYGSNEVNAMFSLLEIYHSFVLKKTPSISNAVLFQNDKSDYVEIYRLPGMKRVVDSILKVCRLDDIPVMLIGETGTGKEGVANALFRASTRSQKPFIKINCGSIPAGLVESKLFGHQKGSFTGAVKDAQGCFEMADQGSLLLDEIGELPLEAQVHLLRVIQEGCIQRVGSSMDIPVDVRLITATNRDLFEMTRTKQFRSDLFYRLNVFPIFIPPLRERRQDIPILLDFFIHRMCRRFGLSEEPVLTEKERRKIFEHDWPGNIRELQNAVTKAMIMWSGNRDVPFRLETDQFWRKGVLSEAEETAPVSGAQAKAPASDRASSCSPSAAGGWSGQEDFPTMEGMERHHIQRALEHCSGRINGKGGAAQLLGMAPSTLRARIKKLGIERWG